MPISFLDSYCPKTVFTHILLYFTINARFLLYFFLMPSDFLSLTPCAILIYAVRLERKTASHILNSGRIRSITMGERLTPSDVEKIQKEIDHRKLVVRKAAIEAVKEARAQGDLSENFEYYAAKKDKNQNESRIRYLERMLKNATIIEDHTSEDEVGINTTYKLVTSIRSSSLRDMVSIESPLGKAIRGKKVGETATVQVDPSFSYDVVIKKIDRNVGDEDDQIRRY